MQKGILTVIWWWRICGEIVSLVFALNLENRKYILFCVAQKINENAYVLQLLDNWNISYTFNVTDLLEYHPDDEALYKLNLGTLSLSTKILN